MASVIKFLIQFTSVIQKRVRIDKGVVLYGMSVTDTIASENDCFLIYAEFLLLLFIFPPSKERNSGLISFQLTAQLSAAMFG